MIGNGGADCLLVLIFEEGRMEVVEILVLTAMVAVAVVVAAAVLVL